MITAHGFVFGRLHPLLSRVFTFACDKIIVLTHFKRLIRFLARDGRTYYGDAILPQGTADIARTKQARVIKGDIFGKHDVTNQIAVNS